MSPDDIRQIILEAVSGQIHTRMSLWMAVKDKLPGNWRWETFKRWHQKMRSEKLLGSTMSGGVTITDEGRRHLSGR